MKHDICILESPTNGGVLLRCSFTRRGDRYAQSIELVVGSDAALTFTSVEGDDRFPPSPPWQELHIHDGADGKALMLVGRAGKSHWSMSVTADEDSPALIFDVACRLREPPGFLGTTYQLSSMDFQVRANGDRESRTDLEIHPTAAGRPSLLLQVDEIAGIASATIEVAGDQVIIRAPQPTQPHATVRWKYRLSLCDAASETR